MTTLRPPRKACYIFSAHYSGEFEHIEVKWTTTPKASHNSWVVMPRNESPANTIMRDVVSGEESGIYHLLISSLPFGTRWQALKDWVREGGCEVDHVEVFQKSTNGWIRLLGRKNFDLALRHLRTSPFAGREIIVDERNTREPIKILELIDDPPPKPRFGGSVQGPRKKVGPAFAASVSTHAEPRASKCPGTTISLPHGQPVMYHSPLGNAMAPMCTNSHRMYTLPAELEDSKNMVTVVMPGVMTGFTLKYGMPYAVSPRFCEPPHEGSGMYGVPPFSTSKLMNWHHEDNNASGRSGWVSYPAVPSTTATASEQNYPMAQRRDDGYSTLQPLSLKSSANRGRLKGAGSSEMPLPNHCKSPVADNAKDVPAQLVGPRNTPLPTKYAPPVIAHGTNYKPPR